MKAHYRIPDKNLMFEIEKDNVKELFEDLAVVQEVFGEGSCGACGDVNIQCRARKRQKYTFYELHCQNPTCRARLSFGAYSESDGLFPHRKDKAGNWKPNRGWEKYQPSRSEDEGQDQ